MKQLLPIIRRIRRPLMPPEEPTPIVPPKAVEPPPIVPPVPAEPESPHPCGINPALPTEENY